MKHLLLTLLLSLPATSCMAQPNPYAAVAKEVLPAIAQLVIIRDPNTTGVCTAFAVSQTHYLTAAHCLGGKVLLNGQEVVVAKEDDDKDLALLVVPTDLIHRVLHIRTKALSFLEEVMGIGHAYGWEQPFVVLGRMEMQRSPMLGVPAGNIYSGAFINGMSGGPVVDMQGEVVGMCQRSVPQSSYGVDGETLAKFIK